MADSGYTNEVLDGCGVVKSPLDLRGKGFKTPEEMLQDFAKWMKADVERVPDYAEISRLICEYELDISGSWNDRYYTGLSKLAPAHALVIWEMKGQVSAIKLSDTFCVDVKTVRNIWNGVSWGELTVKYEVEK